MTLPLSLLLLDAYPLRRVALGVRALLTEKAGYLVLSGLGAALALFARGHGASWTSYADHGVVARVALAAYSLAFYPLKFVWPSGLSPLYELPARVSALEPRFVAALAAVTVATALLVLLRHRLPGALVAWLHAAVAVAPVSGLVHAGSQLVADRYSYLPGIGFAVVVGAGATCTIDAWRRGRLSPRIIGAMAIGAVVALVALGTLSWQHAWYWRSSVSLWRWAVAADERCMLCHAKLGAALLAADAPAEAEPALRRALELAPDRAGLRVDHGVALALTGREAEAEREFREATRLAPGSLTARMNLAVLYTRQRRSADAVAVLREATAIRPDDPALLVSLGRALVEQGQPRDAAVTLERAVVLVPGLAEARVWLVRAYLAAGEAPRAAPHLAALERLDPGRAAELRRTITVTASGLTRERQLAIALAREVGDLLHRERSGVRRIAFKGSPTNLVTEMDARAEALIVDRLTAAFPDDAILAEERGARAGRSGRRWIIDPLDGTTNYAHGLPIYGVSIALEVGRTRPARRRPRPEPARAVRGRARTRRLLQRRPPGRVEHGRRSTPACWPPAFPTTSASMPTTT